MPVAINLWSLKNREYLQFKYGVFFKQVPGERGHLRIEPKLNLQRGSKQKESRWDLCNGIPAKTMRKRRKLQKVLNNKFLQ